MVIFGRFDQTTFDNSVYYGPIIKVDGVDRTGDVVAQTLNVDQRLTSEVDTARFHVRKAGDRTFNPAFGSTVEVYDEGTKIFGGKVLSVDESVESGGGGTFLEVDCVEHQYDLQNVLASKTYENQTISQIISDLVSNFASSFTANNVESDFTIERIVFNQVPVASCIKQLAKIVQYDWYVDPDKDIHFFDIFAKTAPFDLTDTNGNYVYRSLTRTSDGAQVANTVKVRGGEYNGAEYTDEITVNGNNSKSFSLPYQFANLTVELDTGSGFVEQDVGADFVGDFSSSDVLYNFQTRMIRFENTLSDGDVIRFSGNPKTPVFAIAEEPDSIEKYGVIEKLIRDTSIESNEVARKRAAAELYAYSEPIIDARFYTRTSGLRTGMTINVQSDIRGHDDSLLIKKIRFGLIDNGKFGYKVELVSTKRFNFIALLQEMLEPEQPNDSSNEVSEQLFADTQSVSIEEDITLESPFEDTQEVSVDENYVLDPFGDNTNATYVLAPYTPSSQSDPKRPGRLGISFVLS